MTEIPGGDPPICDTCNDPIVGPVIRVGVERFCKPCKEQTVMPWPKVTIEDFRLKTEGTDLCWIEGCEESQRQRGLCKKHYDRARHNRFLTEVVAQIDARSEAPMSLEQVKEVVCKPLPSGAVAIVPAVLAPSTVVEGHSESEGPILFRPATDPLEWRIQEVEAELLEVRAALVAAIGESQDITPTLEKVATLAMQRDRCAGIAEEAQKALQYAHREAGAEAELRALREALAEAVGAHPEPLTAVQQVALLKERGSRGASRDGQYLRALLDVLGVRYDDPRPPDDADGGLTRMARNVLRSWALCDAEAVSAEHCAILKVWAEAIDVGLGDAPEGKQEARVWAAMQWEEYEKWWKDREDRLIEAAKNKDAELSNALGSVRRLADELTAVDAALGPYLRQAAGNRCAAIRFVCCCAEVLTAVDEALGPYRLEATGGNRILAIEALTAPSGEVLLSEANLRERFFRLNEIGYAESLLTGLSEPLQKALRAVLEEQKFQVLRVCP